MVHLSTKVSTWYIQDALNLQGGTGAVTIDGDLPADDVQDCFAAILARPDDEEEGGHREDGESSNHVIQPDEDRGGWTCLEMSSIWDAGWLPEIGSHVWAAAELLRLLKDMVKSEVLVAGPYIMSKVPGCCESSRTSHPGWWARLESLRICVELSTWSPGLR